MFSSKRSAQASLLHMTVMLLLVITFTACTSDTVHWITPVPAPDAAQATADPATPEAALATAAPEVVTPVAEATGEITEESDDVDDEVNDDEVNNDGDDGDDKSAGESSDLAATADEGMPPRVSHKLAGREACSDCHAVDSTKEPAPATHVGMTDNLCLYCHVPEEGEAAVPPLPVKAETTSVWAATVRMMR